jgi:hypothetical protein
MTYNQCLAGKLPSKNITNQNSRPFSKTGPELLYTRSTACWEIRKLEPWLVPHDKRRTSFPLYLKSPELDLTAPATLLLPNGANLLVSFLSVQFKLLLQLN